MGSLLPWQDQPPPLPMFTLGPTDGPGGVWPLKGQGQVGLWPIKGQGQVGCGLPGGGASLEAPPCSLWALLMSDTGFSALRDEIGPVLVCVHSGPY